MRGKDKSWAFNLEFIKGAHCHHPWSALKPYNEPEHGNESMHEPESSMVQTAHYSSTHAGSNDADSNGSHRPVITRKGYKQIIHWEILKIFWQSINEPLITYRKILKEGVTQMFERFRDVKEASINSARKVAHVIAEINYNFEILANYNPAEIHRDVWRRLCRKWDTNEWKKLSNSGKNNYSTDSGGQPNIRVVALDLRSANDLTSEDPSFIDLYYKTHLTAKLRKIYFREIKSFYFLESYNKALSQKYGDDLTQQNVNDPELWTQTQLPKKGGKQKGPIYGTVYSDLHFLMTGGYSYESTSASADFAMSQQEVNELRQQVSNMQHAMDEKQSEMNLQMQQMQNEMELQVERQFVAFMKQINPFAENLDIF
uniref:Uncharacterized protein n=1 Tax=Lactuca sativa TaxID=4236 RepID=A0A9R1WQU9_LACSA|nr:hypothetical protein LSAT_V11C100046680 [Lactuca sativa]